MKWEHCLDIGETSLQPKPFAHNMFSKGVLKTDKMAGPAPFPCPTPCIGVVQLFPP